MEICIQKAETLNALILYLVASHIFNEVCMTSQKKTQFNDGHQVYFCSGSQGEFNGITHEFVGRWFIPQIT